MKMQKSPPEPMTGYMCAPAAIVADPEQLREWLRRAFEYAPIWLADPLT
jgi:hypothetical protein